MAIQYTIIKVENVTTSTGKPMYKSTLKDPEGKEETINLFDMVVEGAVVNGEIYTNDKGYRNFKSAQAVAGGAFKTAQMEKAVERKEQGIARSQENKEWGIKVSSTMGGAVNLAIAQFKGEPNDLRTLEELVIYYRRFLFDHWDDAEKFPPFN